MRSLFKVRIKSETRVVGLCSAGANITGIIPGFNTTVLKKLPRSMLLIKVESVLMGFAFFAMIIVRSRPLP